MIVLAGGTGLVGSALANIFEEKQLPFVILTRQKSKEGLHNGRRYVYWDPQKRHLGDIAFPEIKAIINLSGANVAEKRWSKKRKQEILESRTASTAFLSSDVAPQCPHLETFIQFSAIGYYGEDHGLPFHEGDISSLDFLGTTCKAWEDSLHLESLPAVRSLILRVGLVFSAEGGFFQRLKPWLAWGICPIFGHGKQYLSWIHLSDLCALVCYLLSEKNGKGVYNAVAHFHPQGDLLSAYFTQRKKKGLNVKIPASLLRFLVGEMSIELLKSAKVSNEKICQLGFQFQCQSLDAVYATL